MVRWAVLLTLKGGVWVKGMVRGSVMRMETWTVLPMALVPGWLGPDQVVLMLVLAAGAATRKGWAMALIEACVAGATLLLLCRLA